MLDIFYENLTSSLTQKARRAIPDSVIRPDMKGYYARLKSISLALFVLTALSLITLCILVLILGINIITFFPLVLVIIFAIFNIILFKKIAYVVVANKVIEQIEDTDQILIKDIKYMLSDNPIEKTKLVKLLIEKDNLKRYYIKDKEVIRVGYKASID